MCTVEVSVLCHTKSTQTLKWCKVCFYLTLTYVQDIIEHQQTNGSVNSKDNFFTLKVEPSWLTLGPWVFCTAGIYRKTLAGMSVVLETQRFVYYAL